MADIRDGLFRAVYEIASADKSVVFLTADADAHGLVQYKRDFSERFYDTGVAEQNTINVASGLALAGKRVFVYSLLPFLTMRCYEQLKINICGMNLPVILIGLGSGFSFDFDGSTHHGVCDVSVMRTLPEITIINPSSSEAAYSSVYYAFDLNKPTLIRLDKGNWPALGHSNKNFTPYNVVRKGSDVLVISTGTLIHTVNLVVDEINSMGFSAGLVECNIIKPLLLDDILVEPIKKIVVIEENVKSGGLKSAVLDQMSLFTSRPPVFSISVEDEQTHAYGSRDWLLDTYGLSKDKLLSELLRIIRL